MKYRIAIVTSTRANKLLLDELFKLGTVAAIDIRDYADLSLESFEIVR